MAPLLGAETLRARTLSTRKQHALERDRRLSAVNINPILLEGQTYFSFKQIFQGALSALCINRTEDRSRIKTPAMPGNLISKDQPDPSVLPRC